MIILNIHLNVNLLGPKRKKSGLAWVNIQFNSILYPQVSDSVQLVKNAEEKSDSQSAGRGFVDEVESYITSHDLKVQLPGPMAGNYEAL